MDGCRYGSLKNSINLVYGGWVVLFQAIGHKLRNLPFSQAIFTYYLELAIIVISEIDDGND